MYRRLETKFWTDPEVEKLTPEGKLVFAYLITSPASHFSGIYHISIRQIAEETRLATGNVETIMRLLSRRKFAQYDQRTSTVWIPRMLAYQQPTLNENMKKGIINHLRSLHCGRLIQGFLLYKDNRDQFRGVSIPSAMPSARVRRGSRKGIETHARPMRHPSETHADQGRGRGRGSKERDLSIKKAGRKGGGYSSPPHTGEPSVNQKKGNRKKGTVDKCEAVWLARLINIQGRIWGSVLLHEKQLNVLLDGEGKAPGFGDPRLLWLAIARTKTVPRIPMRYFQIKAKDQDAIHRLRKQADNMTDGDFDK